MEQLVQLENELTDDLENHNALVLVIFRKESDGQAGLEKVVDTTSTSFLLALDLNSERTRAYSPGWEVHDSYVVDQQGVIRAVLKGTRSDRVRADELAAALDQLARTD